MKFNKLKTTILALLTISILIPTINVYATRNLVTTRLGGKTRFETAIEISKEYVKQAKSPVTSVVLCTAFEYADSVSVTPFAVYINAPILITGRYTLDPETKARISEMAVKNVYAIGGTGVISDAIVADLTSMGVTVERIGGKNRYETNKLILAKIPASKWGKNPKIISGQDPYNGLAFAADTVCIDNTTPNEIYINPIIMEDTSNYNLSEVNLLLEKSNKFWGNKFRTLGLHPVFNGSLFYISDFALYSIGNFTNNDGSAVCDVNYNINNFFYKNFNTHPYSQNSAMLTTGYNYIDAISAGPLSAITYSPITFIKGTSLYKMGLDSNKMKSLYTDTASVYYIGGSSVVKDGSESILNGEDIK